MSKPNFAQHPGHLLRDNVLPVLGISVTQAAFQLSVSRVSFSRVLHGRAAISPKMAIRIESGLSSMSGDARLWLSKQYSFDLLEARQRLITNPLQIKPLPLVAGRTKFVDILQHSNPGQNLRAYIVFVLEWAITDVANELIISREALFNVLAGRVALTPTMSLRFEKWLGVGHGVDALQLLLQQCGHDLDKARLKFMSNP
jgi:addiction module HigA family antidote